MPIGHVAERHHCGRVALFGCGLRRISCQRSLYSINSPLLCDEVTECAWKQTSLEPQRRAAKCDAAKHCKYRTANHPDVGRGFFHGALCGAEVGHGSGVLLCSAVGIDRRINCGGRRFMTTRERVSEPRAHKSVTSRGTMRRHMAAPEWTRGGPVSG